MDRIVVAFTRSASREIICNLIQESGFTLQGSFRSGAEALKTVREMGGGVVVCGYRLADMTADELASSLDGRGRVLVVGSPSNLSLVTHPGICCVSSPISQSTFYDALSALLKEDELAARTPPRRSPEETALIQRAKALLMQQGMTEQQAHSTLQQHSMRSRCKLVDVARQIIGENDV